MPGYPEGREGTAGPYRITRPCLRGGPRRGSIALRRVTRWAARSLAACRLFCSALFSVSLSFRRPPCTFFFLRSPRKAGGWRRGAGPAAGGERVGDGGFARPAAAASARRAWTGATVAGGGAGPPPSERVGKYVQVYIKQHLHACDGWPTAVRDRCCCAAAILSRHSIASLNDK